MSTSQSEAIASFIAEIKATPSTFAPKEARKTVKDQKPGGKGASGCYTSKDKAVLGVDEDHSITWSAFHLSSADSNQFRVFAEKVIGRPSFELAADILSQWFDSHRDEIAEATTDFMKEEKTEEDLEREMKAALAKFEKAKALLASMKG